MAGKRYFYDGTFKDYNGKVIASGSVAVTLAGTSTAATIYSSETTATAETGGIVTSNTYGYFYFWVDIADYDELQKFKITLTKTGYSTKEYDNIVIFPGNTVKTVAGLRGFTPTANQTAQLLGYYAAGDTDMPLYRGVTGAAPGTYVDNNCSILVPTGGDGSTAWLWVNTGPVNAKWCGASADTDLGITLSRAFALFRGSVDPDYYGGEIYLPADVRYAATTAINATDLAGANVKLRGASWKNYHYSHIWAKHNTVVLDCTGSPHLALEDIAIQGGDSLFSPTGSTVPTVGILLARKDPGVGNDAGYHRFRNVRVGGFYSSAAIYNYAAEVEQYDNLYLENRYANGKVMQIVQTNVDSIASDFVTIATGSQSTTVVRWNGGELVNEGGSGANRIGVYMSGAGDISTQDVFCNVKGLATFYVAGDVEHLSLRNIREEVRADGPDYSLYSGANITGLDIIEYRSSAKETTGYKIYGADNKLLTNVFIRNMISAYTNNGHSIYNLSYADIDDYKGEVRNLLRRSKIAGATPSITSNEQSSVWDWDASKLLLNHKLTVNGDVATSSSVVTDVGLANNDNRIYSGRLATYMGLTGDIANGATVDITGFMSRCLYGYMVQSDQNTNHMSAGLFRTNAAGFGSNALTLFSQSESSVAVTAPANDTIRITNNTGGTIKAYYRFTVIAG